MPRIFRYRWLILGVIILGLVSFLVLRVFSFPLSGHTSSPSDNGKPAMTGSTPHVTSTPTHTANPPGAGTQGPLRLSSDPYTNDGSQHQVEVEPGSYSYGSTIVTAFQAGRFRDFGSSNIGWATSTDGGTTWQSGFLTGTTRVAGGPYDRITDPAVTYDAAHDTWMIATVVFQETAAGFNARAVLVSLSTNGGTTWSNPVIIADVGTRGELDKEWIVCDNTPTSVFYGNCYAEWDDYTRGDLIQMSTSKDGGRTWGAAKTTTDQASGTSGYPLVQPDGKVIVPISNGDQTAIIIFSSTDGGESWSRTSTFTAVTSFSKDAFFTDNILLNAEVDGAGTIYLVWVDCRFEADCHGNDLVMTTSTNGITWTSIRRIPIAPMGSGINYYVSGLGVDKDTSGTTAHLALAFYYYSADCFTNCKLSVGFVLSTNGGDSWTPKVQLTGPMSADWIAQGNNKVGDYITTSFSGGKAFPIFSLISQEQVWTIWIGTIFVNEEVRRFDVAVNNPVIVGKLQRGSRLTHKMTTILRRERAGFVPLFVTRLPAFHPGKRA